MNGASEAAQIDGQTAKQDGSDDEEIIKASDLTPEQSKSELSLISSLPENLSVIFVCFS